MNDLNSTAHLTLVHSENPSAVHMVTIKRLALETGVSEYHIRKLCKTNQIKYIKTGTKYLINYERFIDYLNGN